MPEVQGSWTGTVKTNTGVILRVRNAPSLSGTMIGQIPSGTNIKMSKESNGWYWVDSYGGWSSGTYIINISGGPSNTTAQPVTKDQNTAAVKKTTVKSKYISAEEMIKQYKISTAGDMDAANLITKNLNGIYGIPYQFMSSVDKRVEGSSIGKIYADKIVTRMPLLLLSPGRVNFMRDYKDKSAAAQAIMKLVDSVNPVEMEQLVDKNVGRYYTFEYDYVNYYGCVNQMISSGAIFLGLQNTKVNVCGKWQKLSGVDWASAGNDGFKGILSKREYIAFYIDSTNQVSESFQNTTSESQLSSTVNSVSDIARELQFLLGNTGMIPEKLKDEAALNSAMDKIDDIAKNYLNDNKLLKDIGKQFATVAVGGKLLFPEIWNDSSFTKSYNISIKLRTPDGDKLSWFMNIYVPLCHLICLTAPIQSEHGVSGYVSPFLVRGFYRGLFNCDMGIITDLNITKGKEGAWTIDGLPTEVDVDLTLKDLYSALTITKENNPGAFCNNLCLVDYIANTCGININEPDFIRQMDMYLILKLNKYKHFIPHAWQTVQQDSANRIMTLYDKMQNLLF